MSEYYYYITDVQLGLLKALAEEFLSSNNPKIDRLVKDIIGKQFIGNFPCENDKKRFKRKIKNVI